jgi:hypothetical protein
MGIYECNRLAGWLQFLRFSLSLITLTWLLTACVAPQKYTPTIIFTTLEQSEPSISIPIPITVRLVKLVDVSPAEDKEDGWLYGSGCLSPQQSG